MIAAFDLATRTGWCHLGKALESGWFDLKRTDAKDASWGFKLRVARVWIRSALQHPPHDLQIVVEQPQQYRSRNAARVAWGLYTVLLEEAGNLGLIPFEIPGGTLKKWATGDGRAKKPAMVKAANLLIEATGRTIKDHNEADAILLAFHARDIGGLL